MEIDIKALFKSLGEREAILNANELLLGNDSKPGIKTAIDLSVVYNSLSTNVIDFSREELPALMDDIKKQWNASYITLDGGNRDLVKRNLHTIKGNAMTAGAKDMHQTCHEIETLIEQYESEIISHPEFIESSKNLLDDLENWYQWLMDFTYPIELHGIEITGRDGLAPDSTDFVRVNLNQINHISNTVDDTLMDVNTINYYNRNTREQITQMSAKTDLCINLLKELEMASYQRQEKVEKPGIFDELEIDSYSNKAQDIIRLLSESINDFSSLGAIISRNSQIMSDSLLANQKRISQTRDFFVNTKLVPIDTIFERLERTMISSCEQDSKKAALEFRNNGVLLDKFILDKIVSPLEHLIRNSVAHGIESPENRAQANKPEKGQICIESQYIEDKIRIICRDDGNGIDLDSVKERGIHKGLLVSGNHITEQDIINLIFTPGFSTVRNVSNIAGRGVGMDVVKTSVTLLGGHLYTETEKGKGTSFILEFPLTLTRASGLIIKAGKTRFAIPSSDLSRVHLLTKEECLELIKKDPNCHFLDQLIGISQKDECISSMKEKIFVLEFNNQYVTYHLIIDDFIGVGNFMLKPATAPFSYIKGVKGLACLSSGDIIMMIQPYALEYSRKNEIKLEKSAKKQKVMVIDDSITIRKMTRNFLVKHNFDVLLAKNGRDAIEILSSENTSPDVFLVDMEMPEMNGLEFAEYVKSTPQWKDIPLVMITSRTGEKHKAIAFSKGVDYYMGKPYREDELLKIIHSQATAK